MGLNVFKDYKCWSLRYKLTHPWVTIVDKQRDLKAGWQRATKGYASRDVWNMDDWFLHVFPAMLRDLAENCHGYPGMSPLRPLRNGKIGFVKWQINQNGAAKIYGKKIMNMKKSI